MNLTPENYFSVEANMQYMGSTQYKDFSKCESMALAKVKGDFEEEKTTSLFVGSYIDSYFSKTLDQFKTENLSIFVSRGENKGQLRSEFLQAEYIIKRIERDPFFMKFITGETQVIKTGEIAGVPVKIKIDCYHPGQAITDLKIIKDFNPQWKDGLRLNFIEYWGYDIQGCIYQAVEGNHLPFIIAAATKEKEPDLAIISIPQERLDYCLEQVKANIQRFDAIKKGLIEPVGCQVCDWCKRNKVLTNVIDWEELCKR
jgi:hypothetical protein